MKTEKWK